MSLVTGFWREICVPLHNTVSPPTVLQERKPSFTQHLDLFPQRPNLRTYIPTKTRPDPCPAPSGDPAPPPFVVFPGPSSEDEWPPNPSLPGPPEVRPSPPLSFPHTHSILSYLRVVPAVAAGPASERTLQNGDGRSSLGATGRFLARQLTHARVRAACLPSPSQERGDQSCGRTQLSAPRAGAGSGGDGTAGAKVSPPPAPASQSLPWEGVAACASKGLRKQPLPW